MALVDIRERLDPVSFNLNNFEQNGAMLWYRFYGTDCDISMLSENSEHNNQQTDNISINFFIFLITIS